ncbi:hypothetical protein BS17DRAFT_786686 [Gyrodon lividus]|nr:hypothetical protein BS17DRAFT_786686 [Gyrodon lividus]
MRLLRDRAKAGIQALVASAQGLCASAAKSAERLQEEPFSVTKLRGMRVAGAFRRDNMQRREFKGMLFNEYSTAPESGRDLFAR